MSERIGIIDLGSNSIRLILMNIGNDGSCKLLDEIKESARISEKMGPEKVIKLAAMSRAVQTVKLFKKFADINRVDTVIGVATAAVRSAVNGNELLSAVKNETGLTFRILSGEEEASYEYLGVVNTFDFNNALIMDIGGGSTELILCQNRQMVQCASLPFGAVSLTENFLSCPIPQTEEIKKLEDFLFSQYSNLPWLEFAKGMEVLGVGGTIRNLGRMCSRLNNYSFNILHNYCLNTMQARHIYNQLKSITIDERKGVPGLSKERADIIVGGVAAVVKLLEFTDTSVLRISGAGLREGVFFEYLYKKWPKSVMDNVSERSVQNFMNLYGVRRHHAEHVAKISLSLFDQLRPLHGYELWERKLLRMAALLHDVGNIVSYYNHHKHTMYILLNDGIKGLSHRENILVALIASSHGKIEMKNVLKEHADILLPQDVMLVRKLGLLLKMAENLDRSESSVVEDVVCNIDEKEVRITCITKENADLEIRELYKKVTNFNKVFGKRFKFPREEQIEEN